MIARTPQPSIVSCLRFVAHECIVDEFITAIDLLMNPALIVVPNLSARLRKHRANAKHVKHSLRLEYLTLWIDQRNALAVDNESCAQIVRCHDTSDAGPLDMVNGSKAQTGIIGRIHACSYRSTALRS